MVAQENVKIYLEKKPDQNILNMVKFRISHP